MFGLKETAYDALGFPDNMTYEKRSELRKECSKFLRFAYSEHHNKYKPIIFTYLFE